MNERKRKWWQGIVRGTAFNGKWVYIFGYEGFQAVPTRPSGREVWRKVRRLEAEKEEIWHKFIWVLRNFIEAFYFDINI
jgi:hypothetical protein